MRYPTQRTTRNLIIGVSLMIGGCCINNVTFEYLMRHSPSCGNLMTLCQFLLIALEGLLTNLDSTSWTLVRPNVVPMRMHMFMVVLFFLMSTLNNKATSFQISVPLHMIFRSGSLLSSMVLGVLLLQKQYSRREVLAVVMVTLSIAAVTLETARSKARPVDFSSSASTTGAAPGEPAAVLDVFVWLIGVLMLAAVVVLSSLLGIVQEMVKNKYPGTAREVMFYTHLLSLPFFALAASDIRHHIGVFTASEPVQLLPGLALPRLWAMLAVNVAFQYVCIRGVYLTYDSSSALSATLVMTVRKFASLVLSILIFRNPFTLVHWLGTIVLFAGTLVYSVDFAALAKRD